MLEAYSTNLAVTSSGNITFTNTNIKTGNTTTLSVDNATINFNTPGIYRVDFNATASCTADGTASVQLMNGTTAVPRASASATIGAGDTGSLAFSTFIPVNIASSGTAAITIQSTGSAGTWPLANVIVTKVR